MSANLYPEGIDCVWLASDHEGHVGAFVTAGAGPMPAETLSSIYIPVEDIEERLLQLPLVSQVQLLVSVKRPDDFVDLAERGVFVYDWTDINRTARDALGVYELVATPVKPVTVNALPSDLAALVKILRLVDVVFAVSDAIDVRAHWECSEAE